MDRRGLNSRAIVGSLTAVLLCVGVGTAALGAPHGGDVGFGQILTEPLTTLLTTTTLGVEPVDSVLEEGEESLEPAEELLEPAEELLEPTEELLDPAGDLLTTTTTTTTTITTTSIATTTSTSSATDDTSTRPVEPTSTTEATDAVVAPPTDGGSANPGQIESPETDLESGLDGSSPPDLRLRSFLASSDPIVGMDRPEQTPNSARSVVLALFADGLGSPLGILVLGPLLALATLWDAVLSAGAGLAGPASALTALVVALMAERRRPGSYAQDHQGLSDEIVARDGQAE